MKSPPKPVQSDDDDEPVTRPTLGSYSTFQLQATRSAKLLEEVVLVSRKRVDFVDRDREQEASRLAHELRAIALRFGRWPNLSGEAVALERATMVPELFRLQTAAIDLLSGFPSHGTLGVVHRRDE